MSVFSIFFNQPRVATASDLPENIFHPIEGSAGIYATPGSNLLFEFQATYRPHTNINLSTHIFTDWRERVLGTLTVGAHIPITGAAITSFEVNGGGGIGGLLDMVRQTGIRQIDVTFNGLTWYLGLETRAQISLTSNLGIYFSFAYMREFGADVRSNRPILPTGESGNFDGTNLFLGGVGVTVGANGSLENHPQEPIHERENIRRERIREQPDNSEAGLQRRLRSLGIAIGGRFDPAHTRSLVENRELIGRLSHQSNPRFTDTRPIAVVIDPTSDHNGAFNSRPEKPINVLAADSRFFTLYYQANTETELREALTSVARFTGRSVHTLIIGGHGQRTNLQLGNPPSTDNDPYYLSSDEIMRGELDYLGNIMDSNEGELLLFSCSNGDIIHPDSNDSSLPNVATALSNRVRGINIYSMSSPSNIRSFRMREDLTMAVEWIEATPTDVMRHHNNRPSIQTTLTPSATPQVSR